MGGLKATAQKVLGSGWNQQQIPTQVSGSRSPHSSVEQQRANGARDPEDRTLLQEEDPS